MKHEAAKQTRMKETNQRKLRQMEEQKAEMETQKEMLKAHISALEKGTETLTTTSGLHLRAVRSELQCLSSLQILSLLKSSLKMRKDLLRN